MTRVVLFLGVWLFHASTALAQRPRHAPTRLEPGESIRVDGVLNDAVWARATPLGELTQVEPVEGAHSAS